MTVSPAYNKHEFACIPIAAVHNNAGSIQVRVALKYEQFLCTVPLFSHENTKNGRQNLLTSIIMSLLWST